jgi:hypothetical protein
MDADNADSHQLKLPKARDGSKHFTKIKTKLKRDTS